MGDENWYQSGFRVDEKRARLCDATAREGGMATVNSPRASGLAASGPTRNPAYAQLTDWKASKTNIHEINQDRDKNTTDCGTEREYAVLNPRWIEPDSLGIAVPRMERPLSVPQSRWLEVRQ